MTTPSSHTASHRRTLSTLGIILLTLLVGSACSGNLEESDRDVAGAQEQPDATDRAEQGEEDQEREGAESPGAEVTDITSDDPELANFEEMGPVHTVWYGGQEIEVEEIDGDFVYEGDMLLPRELVRTKEVRLVLEPDEVPESLEEYNALTARTQDQWPDGVVHYTVDPALSNQQRVIDAIAHWEEHTNLSFEPRTTQSDYVYFTPGSGCSSYVGMIGGRQDVTLASACSTGNTIHEIGHAIGLWHEHSRVDRDNYLTINWQNIRSGRDHNFKTYVELGFDGDEFTDALDFGSIMMYGPYSFSTNGQPTIVKKDGGTYTVQRDGLSPDDIAGLESLYPADGGEPEYVNGQYYTIAGVRVLRANDLWYFWTKYGFKRVELRNGRWYWS